MFDLDPLVAKLRPIMLTAIVDASHRADRGVTGIGVVLHATDRPDRAGPVIAQIAEPHAGVPANAIELFAVFRALERVSARAGVSHPDRGPVPGVSHPDRGHPDREPSAGCQPPGSGGGHHALTAGRDLLLDRRGPGRGLRGAAAGRTNVDGLGLRLPVRGAGKSRVRRRN